MQTLKAIGHRGERDGYVGLFAIANLRATQGSLEFDLIGRLANLK
jgi:hypothetical protein